MKNFFFLLFLLFLSNNTFANEKIVYLDVNFVISQSEAGKYINNELQKINKQNLEEFKKIETAIKSEEDN